MSRSPQVLRLVSAVQRIACQASLCMGCTTLPFYSKFRFCGKEQPHCNSLCLLSSGHLHSGLKGPTSDGADVESVRSRVVICWHPAACFYRKLPLRNSKAAEGVSGNHYTHPFHLHSSGDASCLVETDLKARWQLT